MMQRRGSFFVLICILRQTITQQLSQDAYQKGAVPSRRPTEDPKLDTERQTEMLMMSAADIIHGTNPMVWRTADIRMRSDQCASFEVGFVFKTLEDTFRKMLDIYNMTTEIRKNRTAVGHGHHGDHMVYLQKIEKLHWRVYHLHNMLHEVERKYKMDATINASGVFEDGKRWTRTTTDRPRKTWTYTSKRTTSWWRPLEYGWNTDYYFNWK
ncbi:uncharacterized protein LOC133532231 isoform X2 [Cydia pomonella]|uniref:uncharacterized protein LOC133532231 isoform X2 n=1 Tax=Cydia pomonella TaxID=82600 RepID=UPI002ADE7CD1|nr:uncharacterized protein LOC133532231 isoform X2 [Cydia pomonella]